MSQSGLRRVIFCEDLAGSLGPAGGIASHDHDLYIDIGGSRWSKLYTGTVIHHEFFHILDFAMHARVGVRRGLPDKIWEGLNPPEFKYGRVAFGPKNNPLDFTQKGFLARFAVCSGRGQAELYSFMITYGPDRR